MKKVSVMVVAALLSASMFANSANLPKKGATVNGTKPKTEMSKDHKQASKQKAATPKAHKAVKKTSTKSAVKK